MDVKLAESPSIYDRKHNRQELRRALSKDILIEPASVPLLAHTASFRDCTARRQILYDERVLKHALLSWLVPDDWFQCALVSRQWARAIECPSFWSWISRRDGMCAVYFHHCLGAKMSDQFLTLLSVDPDAVFQPPPVPAPPPPPRSPLVPVKETKREPDGTSNYTVDQKSTATIDQKSTANTAHTDESMEMKRGADSTFVRRLPQPIADYIRPEIPCPNVAMSGTEQKSRTDDLYQTFVPPLEITVLRHDDLPLHEAPPVVGERKAVNLQDVVEPRFTVRLPEGTLSWQSVVDDMTHVPLAKVLRYRLDSRARMVAFRRFWSAKLQEMWSQQDLRMLAGEELAQRFTQSNMRFTLTGVFVCARTPMHDVCLGFVYLPILLGMLLSFFVWLPLRAAQIDTETPCFLILLPWCVALTIAGGATVAARCLLARRNYRKPDTYNRNRLLLAASQSRINAIRVALLEICGESYESVDRRYPVQTTLSDRQKWVLWWREHGAFSLPFCVCDIVCYILIVARVDNFIDWGWQWISMWLSVPRIYSFGLDLLSTRGLLHLGPRLSDGAQILYHTHIWSYARVYRVLELATLFLASHNLDTDALPWSRVFIPIWISSGIFLLGYLPFFVWHIVTPGSRFVMLTLYYCAVWLVIIFQILLCLFLDNPTHFANVSLLDAFIPMWCSVPIVLLFCGKLWVQI